MGLDKINTVIRQKSKTANVVRHVNRTSPSLKVMTVSEIEENRIKAYSYAI